MNIGINVKFDSCHFLPNYIGKCSNVHGHTWRMTVEIKGEIDLVSGFVKDFTELKTDVNDLINSLDHRSLNQVLFNPTCENLVNYCWNYLTECGYTLKKLSLQEGDGGYAYREQD